MENLIIEKLQKSDLKEAIGIYDDNHNLKTNYERLFREYDKIYSNPDYLNIVLKSRKKSSVWLLWSSIMTLSKNCVRF